MTSDKNILEKDKKIKCPGSVKANRRFVRANAAERIGVTRSLQAFVIFSILALSKIEARSALSFYALFKISGGQAGQFFKDCAEICGIIITDAERDFIRLQIGGKKQFLCLVDAQPRQIIDKGVPRYFFEDDAEIGGAHVDVFRHGIQAQPDVVEILLYVPFGLFDFLRELIAGERVAIIQHGREHRGQILEHLVNGWLAYHAAKDLNGRIHERFQFAARLFKRVFAGKKQIAANQLQYDFGAAFLFQKFIP
jgi:hypothetical protein